MRVWDDAGNETSFNSDGIPNGEFGEDVISGTVGLPERFIDETVPSTKRLTVGVCNFSGGAANVTTVVTDPNGVQRTINTQLGNTGAEVIVARTGGGNTGGFTPAPGWCVQSGAGGGPAVEEPPAPARAVTPPSPVPAPPSNVFSIGAAAAEANGSLSLNLTAPGEGTFSVNGQSKSPVSASTAKKKKAKAKKKRITVTTGGAVAAGAGPVKIALKPTSAAKKILKKRSLPAILSITFTPEDGTPSTQTRNVTFKKIAKAKKKKK